MSTSEFIRHHREFFDLLTSDEIDVQECFSCIMKTVFFVKYKNNKDLKKMSPNANPIIASYVTSHAPIGALQLFRKNREKSNIL